MRDSGTNNLTVRGHDPAVPIRVLATGAQCRGPEPASRQTYVVWFERIGVNRQIPPLDVQAADLTALTEKIRQYAQGRCKRGHITVDLDVQASAGELADEDGPLGHFVVSVDRMPAPIGGAR